MKRILLAIVCLFSIGCANPESPTAVREKKDGYSIIIIDNCEYIEVAHNIGLRTGYYSLTHKGNCKNHN